MNCEKFNLKEKQKIFEKYCAHLAKGKFSASFYYEHPKDGRVAPRRTVESWIERGLFDEEQKDIARAKQFQHWEEFLVDTVTGDKKSHNNLALRMIMRNVFKWDTRKEEEEINIESALMKSFFDHVKIRKEEEKQK